MVGLKWLKPTAVPPYLPKTTPKEAARHDLITWANPQTRPHSISRQAATCLLHIVFHLCFHRWGSGEPFQTGQGGDNADPVYVVKVTDVCLYDTRTTETVLDFH